MNWREVLSDAAARHPGKRAFSFHNERPGEVTTLDYAGLDARARAIGAELVRRGLTGRTAVLLFPAGLDYVATFFGCLYAGVIAVPAYPPGRHPRSLQRLFAMLRDCGAGTALTTAALRDRLTERLTGLDDAPALRVMSTDDVPEPGDWTPPPVSGDDIAFLQYTSGSTSTPRGVVLSHANLLANTAMIQRVFGLGPDMRGVSWLPVYHDMGLIGSVLATVHRGGEMSLMAPATFAQDPYRWLELISRERANVSGGPNFAYDLAAERITVEQRATLDLSCWKTAYNGAEPVRARTLSTFAETFAGTGFRASAFLPCYGLAEGSLLVTAGPLGAGFRTTPAPEASGATGKLVASGELPPEQELRIVDPETREPVPGAGVGEIWVSGPSVARGYYNRTDAVADTFGARLADGSAQSFLRTGDLGFLRDGQLYVTGRRKDLIVVRGRNHYPQDIEQTVETVSPALKSNGGAAFSVETGGGEEQLVVVHELQRDHEVADLTALATEIQQTVAVRHEVRPAAVVLIRASSLPRTSSGKVARHACRRAYLDGDLLVLGATAGQTGPAGSADEVSVDPDRPDSIAEYLRACVAERLGTDPAAVPLDRPLSELGLDSLDLLRLQHRVQSRLHVDIGGTQHPGGIAALAEQIAGRPRTVPMRDSGDATGDFPPSDGQRAMWFLAQLAPENTAYHISTAAEITGDLNAEALCRALGRVVARHAALRTTFPAVDGEPVQRVHADLAPAYAHHDATAWTAEELATRLREAAHRPFDLAAGPLVRLELFHRGAADHRMVLAVHHLVTDLWSMEIVLRELDAAYRHEAGAGPAPDATPAPGFAVVQRWTGSQTGETALAHAEDFWREELRGAPTVLELRTDRPRRPEQRFAGGVTRFHLDAATSARLAALARAQGTTLYVVLLSAFQLLLSRHTGQHDLLVGSPVHGRTRAETSETVGLFINTAVLRAQIDPRESFTELVRRAAVRVPRALDQAVVPLSRLVDGLRVPRDPGRSPLVQALFTLQRPTGPQGNALAGFILGHRESRLDLGGLDLLPVLLPDPGAQLDLQLTVAEVDGVLGGMLQYDADLFDAATAERFTGQLRTLLTAVAADADRPVPELPLLTPAEHTALLGQDNDTALAYDPTAHLHLRVAAQAAAAPGAPAVTFDDAEEPGAALTTLTYAELDHAVNRLAHRLAGLGVAPGRLVGVHLPRSAEAVVAMLAVLRAGGAYLPLDPDLPAERLRYVLEDSGTCLVLTRGGLPAPEGVPLLDLALEPAGAEPGEAGPPPVEVRPEDAAYVLYTSGSTGRPKGVRIPHGALTNFLLAMRELLHPALGDRLLAVTTFSFDISGLELFLPLITGGVTHIVSREIAQSGPRLRERLDTGDFALMQATPATWQLLVDAGWTNPAKTTVISGGEALPPALAARLLELGGPLWNFYGPTETTIWSTGTPITEVPERSAPLGPPIANTTVHVLDAGLEPVPPGIAGELLIGGDGLADGYLGRPGLTADKFVPDPYAVRPGARLYRTGDLALRTPGGGIELLGRVDDQVKVNGHRIELGEIDTVLGRHPMLRRAVTAVQSFGGVPALVAHVQARHRVAGAAFDKSEAERELRAALRDVLPAYMVPARFVWVTDYPLTANGKVDRKALRAPDVAGGHRGEPPRTETERRLTEILSELLGVAELGRDDNLFDHGAHSLMLSRFQARVDAAFGLRLPLRTVFEGPSVARLGEFVDAAATPVAAPAPRITRIDRSRYARR